MVQLESDPRVGPVAYLRLTRLGVGWLGDFTTQEALIAVLDRMGLDLADFTDEG